MKVYSRNLREKVLKAYNDKKGSMRKLADDFMVSLALFLDLLKDLSRMVILILNLTEEEDVQQWMKMAVNLWLKF